MIPALLWMITGINNASEEVRTEDEGQSWSGLAVVLHFLLPAAGIALLWGRKDFFTRLLLQLDRSCVSVFCPSLSKRESLLKWAGGRLPSTWSSQSRTLSSGIPELWKDGSLLCIVINSVIPGACPNPHRHWKKPPLHAQALAYKYLGVTPLFSDNELSADFTTNQEANFINYLHDLQQAINKWSAKDEATRKFSSQYVARGMGLVTGEQHRKTIFYIYTNNSTKKRCDLLMYVRGPYGTRGKATIPPLFNPKTIPLVSFKPKPAFDNNRKSFLKAISMDLTSLIGGAEDGNSDDIPIQIDTEIDRAKITYIPKHSGMYEINLITDGELLRGSPYNVHITKSGVETKEVFAPKKVVAKKVTCTKRKVVSKIIDCIDEQIRIDDGKVSKTKSRSGPKSKKCLEIGTEAELKEPLEKAEERKAILKVIDKISEEIEVEVIKPPEILDNATKEPILMKRLSKSLEESKIGHYLDNTPIDQEINSCQSCSKLETDEDLPKTIANQENLGDSRFKSNVEPIFDSQEVVLKMPPVILNNLQQKSVDQTAKESKNKESNLTPNFDLGSIDSTEVPRKVVNETKEYQAVVPSLGPGDENNNSASPPVQKRVTSQLYLELSSPSTKPNTSSSHQDTSPICAGHIAPEVANVDFRQLSVEEKRKVFTKQATVSFSDSLNSSLSTTENDEGSRRGSGFRELSVLNLLDTLKQSRKNSYSESYSLSSAVSLPNMSEMETRVETRDESLVKTRKEYWEKMSSCSSSTVSLTTSDFGQGKKFAVNNKNVFNKFSDKEKRVEKYEEEESGEIRKSADDILSVKNNYLDPLWTGEKKYRSMDNTLDDCTIMSIEDRKRILLKNQYESEKLTPKKLNGGKLRFAEQKSESKSETKSTFTSVAERILKFNDSTQIRPKLTNRSQKPENNTEKSPKSPKKKVTKKTAIETFKSPFKKAINYFKNLEEVSKIKIENKPQRRYSLDCQSRNNRNVKKGGSLNLPNISERFSVNNLYDDVVRERRGSFKGTPNKRAVASSLRSFWWSCDRKERETQQEDDIKYNLFVSKTKTKKRRSIKTLFDVNY